MSEYELNLAKYQQETGAKELASEFNHNNDDVSKLKELNSQIKKELLREDSNPLKEITLDDGTKVLALCIRTVNQPMGGFINVFVTEDYKQYYQYTDKDGHQEKITNSWNYVEATGENLKVAWDTLKDGHPWDAFMIFARGAEDPRGMIAGTAPAVAIGKVSTLTSLKNLWNSCKTLFKGKGSVKAINVLNPTASNNPLNISKAAENTIAKLSKEGFECTNVKGAIKATKTHWGKRTTSFINPNNGQMVKTVKQYNGATLITTAQKDGTYIHEYKCYTTWYGKPESSIVIKYSGYSEEGMALSSAKQSIEIIETNLATGKASTTILNNEQIANGLTYTERYINAVGNATKGLPMENAASVASIPSQDWGAISFLKPTSNIFNYSTPVIRDILFVCH